MKFLVLAIIAFAGVVQAKIDWSKVNPKHLTVDPIRTTTVTQPKIVGGLEATPNDFSYQVAVISDSGAFCGGSIIAPTVVLTAAHCVDDAQSATVIAGAHKIQEDEDTQQVIESSKIVVHSGWESWTLRNDIALVHLSKPIQLGATAQILKLNKDDSTLEGKLGLVTGWGLPSDSSSSLSPVLRFAFEYIISNEKCRDDFGNYITDNHICLDGARFKGPCNGDSGGPLNILQNNIENAQAGIVSFGSAAGCAFGYASAFTRVSKYIDWINENSL